MMGEANASTPFPRLSGAGNGVRTRDPKLGKLVLYQLSYARLNRVLEVFPGLSLAAIFDFTAKNLPQRFLIAEKVENVKFYL